MAVSQHILDAFSRISSSTIASVLHKRGLRNVAIRNAKFLCGSDEKVIGEAYTLRFIPMREDLSNPDMLAGPRSLAATLEHVPARAIVVADAMGRGDVGLVGSILCERLRARDIAGFVTDGAVRDAAGILKTGLPVWCQGVSPRPAETALNLVGADEPIACGGVSVFPGDLIVADADGAVAIPGDIVEQIGVACLEQEILFNWIHGEVVRGKELDGLYPPNDATRARFAAWRAPPDGGK